ncbi:siderophore-interacting protein [Vibrio tapetis subsp. quintayensis]|uniref:siderophore-interacting protein n=1 Tax=Vibrio tapetis TaxID=52443 RepID=UPI0025B57370|nr:siderophore-interacting protein [Vibrio tapetis]MDN3682462.1 siderophore-interacting protein [Vibrio tapetis subsp. quintayensis]
MGFNMRMTQVHNIIDLSPHMRRIILSGSDLNDFPVGQESAHVKIVLPSPGQIKPKLGFSFGMKKRMRSYTIRAFDDITKQLTLDFAVNDHQGLATGWASNAQIGDYLGIAGPGKAKYPDYLADWHLLIADLTALPALAAILEKLPESAQGQVLVQVPSLADRQEVKIPIGINLKWVINSDPSQPKLLEELESITWQSPNPAIFVAANAQQVKGIRQYIQKNRNYNSDKSYFSGYWKA